MTGRRLWIDRVNSLATCLGVGGLGAMLTTPEIEGRYKTIQKPLNPPD